ncbi:MAG: TonB C-terminal domain-containing protein [Pseudomonadota bacterium]
MSGSEKRADEDTIVDHINTETAETHLIPNNQVGRLSVLLHGGPHDALQFALEQASYPLNYICDVEHWQETDFGQENEVLSRIRVTKTLGLIGDLEHVVQYRSPAAVLISSDAIRACMVRDRPVLSSRIAMLAGYHVPDYIIDEVLKRRIRYLFDRLQFNTVVDVTVHDSHSEVVDLVPAAASVFEFNVETQSNPRWASSETDLALDDLPVTALMQQAEFFAGTPLYILAEMHKPILGMSSAPVFAFWKDALQLLRASVEGETAVIDAAVEKIDSIALEIGVAELAELRIANDLGEDDEAATIDLTANATVMDLDVLERPAPQPEAEEFGSLLHDEPDVARAQQVPIDRVLEAVEYHAAELISDAVDKAEAAAHRVRTDVVHHAAQAAETAAQSVARDLAQTAEEQARREFDRQAAARVSAALEEAKRTAQADKQRALDTLREELEAKARRNTDIAVQDALKAARAEADRLTDERVDRLHRQMMSQMDDDRRTAVERAVKKAGEDADKQRRAAVAAAIANAEEKARKAREIAVLEAVKNAEDKAEALLNETLSNSIREAAENRDRAVAEALERAASQAAISQKRAVDKARSNAADQAEAAKELAIREAAEQHVGQQEAQISAAVTRAEEAAAKARDAAVRAAIRRTEANAKATREQAVRDAIERTRRTEQGLREAAIEEAVRETERLSMNARAQAITEAIKKTREDALRSSAADIERALAKAAEEAKREKVKAIEAAVKEAEAAAAVLMQNAVEDARKHAKDETRNELNAVQKTAFEEGYTAAVDEFKQKQETEEAAKRDADERYLRFLDEQRRRNGQLKPAEMRALFSSARVETGSSRDAVLLFHAFVKPVHQAVPSPSTMQRQSSTEISLLRDDFDNQVRKAFASIAVHASEPTSVTAEFSLADTGAVTEARLTRASGDAALDQGIVQSILQTQFPRPPMEVGGELSYTAFICFN